MPEQVNVEVAHKLSDRDRSARQKRRWEEVVEILEMVMLALAAVATAWSGYQAAKGEGRQSVLYGQGSTDRFQATTAAATGEQQLAADATLLTAWLQARAANDPQLQELFVRRFSPAYRTAFAAWLGTAPFTNPSAPPGPAYMPQYHNPQLERAEQLNAKATAAEEAGTHAREAADQYVRATVLFALVLFLVALSQRFKVREVRVATIATAFALLAYAISDVATLPRI
jgi:hypothetical protein